MLDKYLNFGNMEAKRIVGYLFWGGTLLSAISSFLFGKYLYLTNTYGKELFFMQNGQKWFTEKQVNHLPLGIGGALVSFIVSVIFLKVACEVLYLIIRCMETYLENSRERF